jgi:hypothetical protein
MSLTFLRKYENYPGKSNHLHSSFL